VTSIYRLQTPKSTLMWISSRQRPNLDSGRPDVKQQPTSNNTLSSEVFSSASGRHSPSVRTVACCFLLFATIAFLFKRIIKQVLSSLGVRWAVQTLMQTCAPWLQCLLSCSNTSSNIVGRPDASSGRPDGR